MGGRRGGDGRWGLHAGGGAARSERETLRRVFAFLGLEAHSPPAPPTRRHQPRGPASRSHKREGRSVGAGEQRAPAFLQIDLGFAPLPPHRTARIHLRARARTTDSLASGSVSLLTACCTMASFEAAAADMLMQQRAGALFLSLSCSFLAYPLPLSLSMMTSCLLVRLLLGAKGSGPRNSDGRRWGECFDLGGLSILCVLGMI